jgi:hypothetical protein
MAMMQDDGEQIGRFKVRSLMRELELVSKQPGSHYLCRKSAFEAGTLLRIARRDSHCGAERAPTRRRIDLGKSTNHR